MKNILKKCVNLAALGVALAWAGGTAHGQISTNLFAFDSSAEGFLFPSWAGQGSSSFWDGTQDAASNPGSGAQYLYQDMSGSGGQLVGFQCFSLNPYYPYVYDNTAGANVLYYKDLTAYTNLSMDVLWDTTYSSIGIHDYNNETFVAGNGTYGVELDFITTANQNWVYLATIQIPNAASNGWTHVNVPIPTGLPLDQTVGFVFKKYTGGGSGVAAMWVDNIAAQAPGSPPPAPTLTSPQAVVHGLNIYDDSSAYDRQSIATVVTNSPTYVTNLDTTVTTNSVPDSNYSWIGSANPVNYSLKIAQAPAASFSGYQTHIMICPGDNVTEVAPDYNEAAALVLFIDRQGNGSVIAQLRYKINDANDNKNLFGSDPTVYGGNGLSFTNTVVAGYGGLLGAVTNVGGFVGTWTMTMTGNTNIALHSPDGSQSTFAFPQLSDAQAFAGPITVFWGTQPNAANLAQSVKLSNVSITGSTSSLNADLTQPLNPAQLIIRASNGSLVFGTPANAIYWLQWTLPDAGYKLQSGASLTGSWTTNTPALYNVGGQRATFITSDMTPAGSGFFRLGK
ncbi:MAG TPA: hypothetical protein VG347_06970 [Verrucomicrobiae bacterium]|nr:hypothetical protein [Verrucomicrobiae bacterium]